MGKFVFCVIFVLFVNWKIVYLHQLPSYITPCKRSEQSFLECVKQNLDVLKPKLKQGIPELFISSLDPLSIPPTTVNEEDKVKVTFTDIWIFNVHNFQINRFDIDLEDHTVNLTVNFPELRIKSTYNINGKFLILTLNKNGPADGNYTNFQVLLSLKGTPYLENDSEYLKWKKQSISISIEKSHIILENIFGSHTDIRDKTNEVINENIHDIISDLQPILQKVVEDLIFNVINNIFSYYSVKELFLD